MRKSLLTTVAVAALIAGGGTALAQGKEDRGTPSRPPAAVQNAPAEKVAPPAERKGLSETGRPGAGTTTGQAAPDTMKDRPAKGMSSDTKSGDTKAGDTKVQTQGDTKIQTQSERNGATGGNGAKSSTTGQGAAASAPANLTTEQQTKIRTVIQTQKVKPVTNVNFSISVGAKVPRTVQFHPVPVEVVTIHPAWRGFVYFLVGEEIVIVNPSTYEIVAVLAA